MKVVIHPPIDAARLEKLQVAAPQARFVNAPDADAALAEIGEADAFLGKITPAMLAASTRLRWVQSFTASLEHYVFPELVAHPCQLTNMRGLFSDVIAEQVFGYLLCFTRNLHRYIRNQTVAKWEPFGGEGARVSFASGPGVVNAIDRQHGHLGGSTLGIVGLGAIGREVARLGVAFNMRVLAVDPVPQEIPPGVEKVGSLEFLMQLLAESDFVVIAAPHTPETARMFTRKQFQQMKPGAYLVNIGRGAIVDLMDLHAALVAGEVAGAALDVFEQEPLPADHPLWRLENVILTPHVAGYSPRIAERHLAVLVENVGRFVRGEPLRNVVNKAMWF